MSTSLAEPASAQASTRDLLVAVAGLTAGSAFFLYVWAGGWEILFFGLPALAICIVHVVVALRAAKRADLRRVWAIPMFILTDLVLLEVVLLQKHTGDGNQWVTVTALITGGGGNHIITEPPPWDPDVALVPLVLLSWALLLIAGHWRRRVVQPVVAAVLFLICTGLFLPLAVIAKGESEARGRGECHGDGPHLLGRRRSLPG